MDRDPTVTKLVTFACNSGDNTCGDPLASGLAWTTLGRGG